MKKIYLFACIALITSNVFSQNKKNIQLKTETDSISYSYGFTLVEQGLSQHLLQQGVLTDTTSVRSSYASKIESEKNASQVVKLKKEMAAKLDSINKANKVNLEGFLKGVNEALVQKKDKDKGYSEGLAVGGQLTKMLSSFSEQMLDGNSVNVDLFVTALNDAFMKEKPLMEGSSDFFNGKMSDLQSKQTGKQDAAQKEKSAAYIAEGDKFMQDNKSKEGVVTLPSGLQYKILKEGTGDKPSVSDVVKVHYRGSLINGTVFDSSIERGEPITFGVTQVIKGWGEALQLMPVGSKWMLYVPYDLGYGSRETGSIPAFSNLIFEVELLGIENQ